MREQRNSPASPWSFFVPVALAVLVGGLLAGLVLRGIDAASRPDRDAPAAVAPTPDPAVAPGAAAPGAGLAAAPDRPGPAPDDGRAAAPKPEAPAPAASVASGQAQAASSAEPALPALPGAIVARRDGAPEACINGTIARRDPHGWQQRLENDAPVACVEASAPAR